MMYSTYLVAHERNLDFYNFFLSLKAKIARTPRFWEILIQSFEFVKFQRRSHC